MGRRSFDSLINESDIRTADVHTELGDVRLGSLSSEDAFIWIAEGEDAERAKLHGLRLLVRCIINEDGSRIGDGLNKEEKLAAVDAATLAMSKRDFVTNGALCKAARILNGFHKTKTDALTDAKNDSPATTIGALPIASPPTAGA